MSVVLESVVACPVCGGESTAIMPTDACLFFWDCPRCKAVIRPKTGDCCVFCSYGSVVCPPMQGADGCCAPRAQDAG